MNRKTPMLCLLALTAINVNCRFFDTNSSKSDESVENNAVSALLKRVGPLNEFVLRNTSLSNDGHLITRHFTLGLRQPEQDRLIREQTEQMGDMNCKRNCTGGTWSVLLEYPKQISDFTITFVDVVVTQTSTGTALKVLEGGYGYQKIRFSIVTNFTSVLDFHYKIYAKDLKW